MYRLRIYVYLLVWEVSFMSKKKGLHCGIGIYIKKN